MLRGIGYLAHRPLFVALAMAATGCGSPPIDPPTAVVRSDPASVCRGDNFQTPVRFDASESQPTITLVPVPADPAAPPLELLWSFAGAEHKELGRDPSGIEVQLSTKGDRPLHVTLVVRNASGGEASTVFSLPITAGEVRRCDEGCPAGTGCLSTGGEQVCAPLGSCDLDIDCQVCWRCDADEDSCVPREIAL